MARYDIMPFTSPRGGDSVRTAYPVTAAQVFRQGEPVELVAAGTLSEGTTPVIVEGGFLGIAADDSLDVDGNSVAVNTLIGVYEPDSTLFVTDNFATDGAGTAAVPAAANLGDAAGLVNAAGTWFVDTGTATNICRIVRILDANKQDIASSGAAGVWVVVKFTAGQTIGDVADA